MMHKFSTESNQSKNITFNYICTPESQKLVISFHSTLKTDFHSLSPSNMTHFRSIHLTNKLCLQEIVFMLLIFSVLCVQSDETSLRMALYSPNNLAMVLFSILSDFCVQSYCRLVKGGYWSDGENEVIYNVL